MRAFRSHRSCCWRWGAWAAAGPRSP